MINSYLASMQESAQGLLSFAHMSPGFSGLKVTQRKDGSSMEKMSVPATYAMRGFPLLLEYNESYLTLRQLRDSEARVARHIVELTFKNPYDQRQRYLARELYAIDDKGLYSKTDLSTHVPRDIQVNLYAGTALGDLSEPLSQIAGLQERSEKFAGVFAKKMENVLEAAMPDFLPQS